MDYLPIARNTFPDRMCDGETGL